MAPNKSPPFGSGDRHLLSPQCNSITTSGKKSPSKATALPSIPAGKVHPGCRGAAPQLSVKLGISEMENIWNYRISKTNSSHLPKHPKPKRKLIFQLQWFRCYVSPIDTSPINSPEPILGGLRDHDLGGTMNSQTMNWDEEPELSLGYPTSTMKVSFRKKVSQTIFVPLHPFFKCLMCIFFSVSPPKLEFWVNSWSICGFIRGCSNSLQITPFYWQLYLFIQELPFCIHIQMKETKKNLVSSSQTYLLQKVELFSRPYYSIHISTPKLKWTAMQQY